METLILKGSSILLYLGAFIMSAFFCHFAEKQAGRSQSKFLIFSVLTLLPLCLVASHRGIGVGTDTKNYEAMYRAINSAPSFAEALQANSSSAYFGFFVLLNRIAGQVFHSYQVLLLFYCLFAVIPVYILAVHRRKDVPAWITLLCFCALFYNESLNIVRQCIAAGFILLSMQYYIEKKRTKCILCLLFSAAFHQTFYIGVAVLVMIAIWERIGKRPKGKVLFLAVMMLEIAVVLNAGKVVNFLISSGIVSGRGTGLLRVIFGLTNYSGNVFKGLTLAHYYVMCCRFLFVFAAYFFGKRARKNDPFYTALLIVGLLDAIFYSSVSILFNTYYIQRITLYLDYFYVLLLAYAYRGAIQPWYRRLKPGQMYLTNVVLLIILFQYWYICYIHHGYDGTAWYFGRPASML